MERQQRTPLTQQSYAQCCDEEDGAISESKCKLDDQSTNRFRNVSFTIGDSSDCDSVSTTTSSYVPVTPNEISQLEENLAANCCNDNPWHKFHFHNEASSDQDESSNKSDDKRMTEENEGEVLLAVQDDNDEVNDGSDWSTGDPRRRKRDPSLSSTRMIPNSTNYSLARLSDIDHYGSVDRDNESETSCCPRTWAKWRIITTCAIVQLFSALMAPFYPAEAEKKASTATEYSFVFSVFELTVFIVAPFYGSQIHKWNPKLVFNIGIFTAAISSIIFGVLDKIDEGRYFIVACAIVRALEALGESAVITASFVIVASAFSESVASTFAVLETFYSVGLISGPIVGSFLYQIGGYSLPFLVVGGGLFVTAILSFFILPSSREISEYRRNESIVISSYKSFRLLGSVPVLVSAICIVIGAMSISYLQATLEPHLRQFQLSQLSVGSIIIINGAVYTVTAPFWGLLCDKVLQLKLVTFCGSALLVSGYSLIGPIPILSFAPTVWIIAIGLTLQGIGLGAILVASFVSILRNVIINGLPDTPSTYGLVMSLWTSMFSLGAALGPTLSGIMYDSVGFSNGTLAVIALTLIMMCILVLFVCTTDGEMESFNYSENEPLMSTSVAASGSLYSNQPNTSIVLANGQSGTSYGSI